MRKYSRYEKYKPSNIDWLGEIPEHWDVKRARFMLILNPSPHEITLSATQEVSFIPMEAIGENGQLCLEQTRPIADVSSGYTYFRENDITFAKITPCFENGKAAKMCHLLNNCGFGTTELTVLRCSSRLNNAYLFYIIKSELFRKNGEAWMYGAGGQKRVPDEFVKNFRFAFPPLSEQQKIADFLDRETAKIDSLIQKRNDLIKLLQEKRSAVISHAVTKGIDPTVRLKPSNIDWLGEIPEHWEVKNLKFLGTALIGLTYSPDDVVDENYLGKKYLVLRSSNIQNNKIELSDTVFVTKEIPQELKVQKDDILICARNGSRLLVGKSARIKSALPNTTFGAFMTVFRSKINPFLSFYFNSNQFQSQTTIFLTTTINQLTNHDLNEVWVSVPPLSEQQEIVDFLDRETAKIDSLIKKEKKIIKKMKEYRTALISAAVTGKIDVRGEVAHE